MTNTGCYKFVKIIWIIVHILGALASLVRWSTYVHKKKQSSKNNEEEKSDKNKFGCINKNGVFWSQACMRINIRLICFLVIELLAICNW